jgi:hypothetical protein
MQKIFFFLTVFSMLSFHYEKRAFSRPLSTINKRVAGDKSDSSSALEDCKKCMILTDISQHRIVIVNTESQSIIWQWSMRESNIDENYLKWFINYSDVKPVYDRKYFLISSSAGGIALLRIADKKVVFYAYAGGNTHSIELLPDGNIVSASSTGGYLTLFSVDSMNVGDKAYTKKIPIQNAHNVVWDPKNKVLWSASMNKLKAFEYNFNCKHPDLILKDTYDLPETNAHDLFPVYGKNALWLTTEGSVYRFDIKKKKVMLAEEVSTQKGIKSISSGPAGFPIILNKPKVSWWTDEIIDPQGRSVFFQSGLKVYKVRWFLPNLFSYRPGDTFRQCNQSGAGIP